MNVVEVKTEELFVDEALKLLGGVLQEGGGKVRIGLSGGKTPVPVYKALAKSNEIDFSQIEFLLVDERHVPFDHPDSNYGMVHSIFGAVGAKIHHVDTALSIQEAVAAYGGVLSNISELDLVILGVGVDGHIASLFPHSKALGEENVLVAHTTTDLFPVRDRMSMTFPMIMKARRVLILLSGGEKQSVADELSLGSKTAEEFPARKLLEHPDVTLLHFKV